MQGIPEHAPDIVDADTEPVPVSGGTGRKQKTAPLKGRTAPRYHPSGRENASCRTTAFSRRSVAITGFGPGSRLRRRVRTPFTGPAPDGTSPAGPRRFAPPTGSL